MLILTNAFSANMLPTGRASSLTFTPVSKEVVETGLANWKGDFQNAIGHADTDSVVRSTLAAFNVPKGERKTVVMCENDVMVVAQYSGPRLVEGATSLPVGATILWFLVARTQETDDYQLTSPFYS